MGQVAIDNISSNQAGLNAQQKPQPASSGNAPFFNTGTGSAALAMAALFEVFQLSYKLMDANSKLTQDQIGAQMTFTESSANSTYDATANDAKNQLTQAAMSLGNALVSAGTSYFANKATEKPSENLTTATNQKTSLDGVNTNLVRGATAPAGGVVAGRAGAAGGLPANNPDVAARMNELRNGMFTGSTVEQNLTVPAGQTMDSYKQQVNESAFQHLNNQGQLAPVRASLDSQLSDQTKLIDANSSQIQSATTRYTSVIGQTIKDVASTAGQSIQAGFTYAKADAQKDNTYASTGQQMASSVVDSSRQQMSSAVQQALAILQALQTIEAAQKMS